MKRPREIEEEAYSSSTPCSILELGYLHFIVVSWVFIVVAWIIPLLFLSPGAPRWCVFMCKTTSLSAYFVILLFFLQSAVPTVSNWFLWSQRKHFLWTVRVFLFGSVGVTRFDQAERSMRHWSGNAVTWREDFLPWKMWCMKILQVLLNLPLFGTYSLPGNKSLSALEKWNFSLLCYFFKCQFYIGGKISDWFSYILHAAREQAWERE